MKLPEEGRHLSPPSHGVRLYDIKYGWLLILKMSSETPSYFHLYSPFTGEIIKFLEYRIDLEFSFGRIVLNSSSLYCIVAEFLQLSKKSRRMQIVFKTYHPGEGCWNEFWAEFMVTWVDSRPHASFLVDFICRDKIVYCLFLSGRVGEFDMEHKIWKWIQCEGLHQTPYVAPRLSMSDDGDIIMLLYSDYFRVSKLVLVWRLDLQRNEWKAANREQICGNEVLFFIIHDTECVTLPAFVLIPALGNARANGTFTRSYSGVAKEPNGLPKDCTFLENALHTEYTRCWIQPPLPNLTTASDLLRNKKDDLLQ